MNFPIKYAILSLSLLTCLGKTHAMMITCGRSVTDQTPKRFVSMNGILAASLSSRTAPFTLKENTLVIFLNKETNSCFFGLLANEEQFKPFFVSHAAKIMRADPSEGNPFQNQNRTFKVKMNKTCLTIPADSIWIDPDFLPEDLKQIA